MEFGILGGLEVRVGGRALPLGGGKQRALLALLLLHANEVVSRDRLIDALWGERPPPSVQQSLDSYISRLRRILGRDRLVRRPAGYALVVEPGELDLERFEELLATAREAAARGDSAGASSSARAALALWRGPALADVLYEPFAAAEAERLEDRRLIALEERLDADLAAGGGAELVPELEALVREHPLRERLLGQLMTALYRAGRHADALAALQAARRRLAGELGLEPGPQLRELERQILQHDPRLAGGRRPRAGPRRRSRRPVLFGLGAAVVAAGAAGVVLATSGSDGPPPAGGNGDQLFSISTRSGAVSEVASLGRAPSALAAGFGSVWVADPAGQQVIRVDPARESLGDRIAIAGQPGSLTTGGGAVWVASTLGGRISRIDPGTDSVTQSIPLGGGNASDIAYAEGVVWVADSADRALIAIEASTGSVRRTLTLDFAPTALVVQSGTIWVAGYEAGLVEQIASRSGVVLSTISVGQGPIDIAAGRDAVWVANELDATVSRIEPGTGSVRETIPVPSGPAAIALSAGSVWVASSEGGAVSVIDPRRNAIVASRGVGGRPQALVAAANRLWVGSASRSDLHRGGTLTIVRTGGIASSDPAFATDGGYVFTRLAYDTLVTFRASAGPAGLRLLPDLAIAVPRSTNRSTTYAFRLRPRIRYSDGRPLRARDFRRAIERLFRVGSPASSYYLGLVGAESCELRPQECRLRSGITTDERARSVVFHLRAPDPDFVYKLTVLGFSAPVPPGVPDHDVGPKGLPGTGPYRVGAAGGGEVRFVRNRFFREWSHAAQPAGNPDAIVWRVARSHRAAVNFVARGRADWLFGLPTPAQLRTLQLRYPAQLHSNPLPVVDFIALNTHRRPFDDVRVRRALNYAIDRTKIARWYGGPVVARPLCQPLAPGLPGHRPYCPYTRRPRRDGAWNGPDLPRAKRLAAASGTTGSRIDVWGSSDQGGVPRQVAPYVAQVLRSLGYRVRLHVVPSATISRPRRRNPQLSVDGDWIPDYPAPSAYLPLFFGCGTGTNFFCDPALDHLMSKATRLQLADPARAAALWAVVDRRLVDQAVWVPTVNVRAVEFVSKRLGNYQFSPVGGFIADQAWIR